MNIAQPSDNPQSALWNGHAGHSWVASQALLDRLFQPFEDLLAGAVAARPGASVLDVGCGTGSTTLAAARILAAEGHCVGVDISAPMIAAAQARSGRHGATARFICADAQTCAFGPASFDLIISRFGVMFFDDPVAAFSNLRQAARKGAGLCLIVWRGAEDNPFMTTAERAAAALLPQLPPRVANAPGQFGFAEPLHVRRILEQSHWSEIDIQPLDMACAMPETELIGYLSRLGPLGRALAEVDEPTRARVIEAVRPAFEPYIDGAEVRFNAACWMVRAQA